MVEGIIFFSQTGCMLRSISQLSAIERASDEICRIRECLRGTPGLNPRCSMFDDSCIQHDISARTTMRKTRAVELRSGPSHIVCHLRCLFVDMM